MHIAIRNGTPRHDVSLCDSCANAKRRRGVRFADTWYGCDEMPGTIPQPVVDCTSYVDNRLRMPAEMAKQAFRWVPSLGKFLAPAEWAMASAKGKLKPGEY